MKEKRVYKGTVKFNMSELEYRSLAASRTKEIEIFCPSGLSAEEAKIAALESILHDILKTNYTIEEEKNEE